jgi:hypothetical protein
MVTSGSRIVTRASQIATNSSQMDTEASQMNTEHPHRPLINNGFTAGKTGLEGF